MRTLELPAIAGSRQATLVVLITPAKAVLEDYLREGYAEALRRHHPGADLVLVEPDLGEILEEQAGERLDAGVIAPALREGVRHIWLCGISLGAFVALHYAARRADRLSGLHLIAPYPGTEDVLTEIRAHGGARAWALQVTSPVSDERIWWRWLHAVGNAEAGSAERLPVYLGLSTGDRFRAGQELLAALLPPEWVAWTEGPHAWPAWNVLWCQWLQRMEGRWEGRLP